MYADLSTLSTKNLKFEDQKPGDFSKKLEIHDNIVWLTSWLIADLDLFDFLGLANSLSFMNKGQN